MWYIVILNKFKFNIWINYSKLIWSKQKNEMHFTSIFNIHIHNLKWKHNWIGYWTIFKSNLIVKSSHWLCKKFQLAHLLHYKIRERSLWFSSIFQHFLLQRYLFKNLQENFQKTFFFFFWRLLRLYRASNNRKKCQKIPLQISIFNRIFKRTSDWKLWQ